MRGRFSWSVVSQRFDVTDRLNRIYRVRPLLAVLRSRGGGIERVVEGSGVPAAITVGGEEERVVPEHLQLRRKAGRPSSQFETPEKGIHDRGLNDRDDLVDRFGGHSRGFVRDGCSRIVVFPAGNGGVDAAVLGEFLGHDSDSLFG